jgi:hypothetical protein
LASMSRKDADGPHLGVRWGEGQVFGVVRKDMADVFLLRACAYCTKLFCLCRRHDRGHAYCGDVCRRDGRKRSIRLAQAKYQRSAEGRADQCDRMRFRRLTARSRVMDQGIEKLARSGIAIAPMHASDFVVKRDDVPASENNDRIDHGSDSAASEGDPDPSAMARQSASASALETSQPLGPTSPTRVVGSPVGLSGGTPLRCIVCGRVGNFYLVGGADGASKGHQKSVAGGTRSGSQRAPPRH